MTRRWTRTLEAQAALEGSASSSSALAALLLMLLACDVERRDGASRVGFPDEAGAAHADGGAEATSHSSAATGQGRPGACLAKEALPRTCDDVCQDEGGSCAEDCTFGTPLPSVAGYYATLDGCEHGDGIVFSIAASCDDAFAGLGLLPYAVARCCCKPSKLKIASAAERQPLCAAACTQDSNPTEPECELLGSCDARCLEATRGLDLRCARCVIEEVSFSPSSCSSWECVYGGASFPSEWTVCPEECAASQQYQRDQYAAEPRPQAVGRAPAARLDAPSIPDIQDLLVDDRDQLWAVATTSYEDGGHLTMVQFDAGLKQRWRWEDPAQRMITRHSNLALLGREVAIAVEFADGSAALLFFDADGTPREQACELGNLSLIAADGDRLLIEYQPAPSDPPRLAIVDAMGSVRFRASFDALAAPRWTYAVHGDGSWSVVAAHDDGLTWQRVAPPGDLAVGSASVRWTRELDLSELTVAGGIALGEELLVWGAVSEQRVNVSGGFPWLAKLGGDAGVRFQWSNAGLTTPGTINDAAASVAGALCTVGEESWEYSTADIPATGPRCSPDGCAALTVRCFDGAGKELWKYHHRSEHSAGYSIAAARDGRIFVAGNITRDSRRSTGTRAMLMRFDPPTFLPGANPTLYPR